MFKRKNLSLIIFCISILILSGLTCVLPWWEASTTKENEILNGRLLKIEYLLVGSVNAFIIDVDYQVTALSLRGKITLDNKTVNLDLKNSSLRVPAKIGLGTFYSTFNGIADVKRSEQGYFIIFNGNVTIEDIVFAFNFTYDIDDELELEEKTYSVSSELELTTSPVTISLIDLESSGNVKYELKSFLDTIWILNVISLGLNVIVFALILLCLLKGEKRFHITLRYALIIAIIMPLITLLLFANNIQGLISKLNNVAPTEVYTLHGSDIKALFGETKDIVYGPSIGWKLAFVIFIMNTALFKLKSKIIKKEEESSKVLNIV